QIRRAVPVQCAGNFSSAFFAAVPLAIQAHAFALDQGPQLQLLEADRQAAPGNLAAFQTQFATHPRLLQRTGKLTAAVELAFEIRRAVPVQCAGNFSSAFFAAVPLAIQAHAFALDQGPQLQLLEADRQAAPGNLAAFQTQFATHPRLLQRTGKLTAAVELAF